MRDLIQIIAIFFTIVFASWLIHYRNLWIRKYHKFHNDERKKREQSKSGESKPPEQQSANDKWESYKRSWERYKYMDNIYHQRCNFFLLAESMLVVSFATTLLVEDSNPVITHNINLIRIAITVLGMVFTFGWFQVNKQA